MFKRNIEKDLLQWKTKENRKPLILRGARQTGKTTVIRQFSKEFKHLVELNLEIDAINKIFSEVKNIDEIIQSIESLANQRIIPGETLLFIDEIQNSIPAIRLLRYFYENIPELHVIAAGSLLEVRMKKEGWSFPVGRVEFLYLYPVSFVEFLNALKEDIILENINNCKINKPLAAPIHEKILKLLADYMVIGGMPEAVQLFMSNKSIKLAREFHTALSLSFKEDFVKYSKSSEVEYLKLVWERVPFEIGNRIKYSKLSGTNTASKNISEAFNILHEAMLVERILPTVNTSAPLTRKLKSAPKAFFLDIGLCAHMLNLSKDQIYNKLINPFFEGALFEEFVGQELLALDPRDRRPLFFWTREEKGTSSELDYIIQLNGRLCPIEVKAGSHGSLKSLHQFLYRSGLNLGIRIYNGQLTLEEHSLSLSNSHVIQYKLLSIPFYLVFNIENIINQISK
ncbi:ATP-binding protein [Candidatus Saganbacteria bacterium]|nr:ATP-binding protein [Candidatus Saganbacteria bacterium]